MGLKDIDIKVSYAGKGGDILKYFLLPSIKASFRYDRVTSFYTVESLLAISQGIDSLYRKQGKMRLIIGIHSFPGEFIDAVTRKKYLADQIEEIRKRFPATGRINDKRKTPRVLPIALRDLNDITAQTAKTTMRTRKITDNAILIYALYIII